MKFWVIFAISFIGCEAKDAAEKFEEQIKQDKNRPGYVGVLRALEVSQTATRAGKDMACLSAIDPEFEGEFSTRFELELKGHGRIKRKYVSESKLIATRTDAQLTQSVETKDDQNLIHERERTWSFVDGETVFLETIGSGDISGTRTSTFDERKRILALATSALEFVNSLADPDRNCIENDTRWLSIAAQVTHVDIQKDEQEPGSRAVKIVAAIGPTKLLTIRYEHEVSRNPVRLTPLPITERAKIRRLRDETSFVESLKKEGFFDD